MRKILRVIIGFLLLALGLLMALPGVPGPGIAVMIVGLVILSDHYAWARRALDWAKRKAAAMRDRVRASASRPKPGRHSPPAQ